MWINKLLSLLCLFGVLHSSLDGMEGQKITKAEDITYEWLHKNGTGYTDHIVHMKKIFESVKIKTFLEFGTGFSTKYFLDHANKVISVEFVTNGYGPAWIRECIDLYHDFSNWIPITFFSGYYGDTSWAPYKYLGSESVYKACSYQAANHKSYVAIDDFYLKELDSFIGNLFKCHNINIAFVDPGIYLRGDLVQLLFNKSPIIIAHDTAVRMAEKSNDVYGYCQITTPENYEEIYLNGGQGTTLWIVINESTKNFIEVMKEYAKTL